MEAMPTYFIFLKTVGHSTVNPLRTECHTKLSDDEISPHFEQATIRTEQLQEVDHERGKIRIVAVFGYLGQKQKVTGDHGLRRV